MKNKAIQLVKYINKVYCFEQFLKNLYDWRLNPSIPKYEADTIVFTGILTGMSSF